MERACKHGYHECRRCVDEADERARQVAKHYEEDLQRDHARRDRTSLRSGWSIHSKPDMVADGVPLGPVDNRRGGFETQPRRCECGSRLQAIEALQTGQCYFCRTGTKTPWTSRCECGSGLKSPESIETGMCLDCRLDSYGDDSDD